MTKSYIYTLVNRLGHLYFIILFALAYIFANFNPLFSWHNFLGVLFLLGICFRIFWGFFGTKYSLFKDFEYKGILAYFLFYFKEKRSFTPHNVASSFAIILMLFLGVLTGFSGLLAYGSEQGGGIFAKLYFHYSLFDFKTLHKLSVNCLLAVILVHILGAFLDKFYHKNDTLNSIISGYKITKHKENVRLNALQKAICVIYLLLLSWFIWYLFYPKNTLLGLNFEPSVFYEKNAFKLYQKECGSCHFDYPPFLLTLNAWEKIMGNLENHYGTDASLDEEDKEQILAFLKQNNALNFDTKFRKSLKETLNELSKEENSTISITKYEFYKKAHQNLNPQIFQRKLVKKENCIACHKDAAAGTFQKENIDFAKLEAIRVKD